MAVICPLPFSRTTDLAFQHVTGIIDGEVRALFLPHASSEVLPGLRWGDATEFFTPAFWVVQAWQFDVSDDLRAHRIGRTLAEEIGACLLGGHGLPAEIGIAAFAHLKGRGLLRPGDANEAALSKSLSEPLRIGDRTVHYRFANQKAKYIAVAMRALSDTPPPVDVGGCALRDWLLRLPGIGPKTASWIVRNWLGSDEVAILDIHLYRAGLLIGIFTESDRIERDYAEMERRFIRFAWAVAVRPSRLDAVIWRQMKEMGQFALGILGTCAPIESSMPLRAW